jgi:urea transporter
MFSTLHQKMHPQAAWWLAVWQAYWRGLGQIAFQPSAVCGLLFFLGVAIVSWSQALWVLSGAALGYIYGHVFSPAKTWVGDGLFGFNAALIGLSTSLFFAPSVWSIAMFVVGVFLACVAVHVCLLRGLACYTAPFVVVTWLMLAMGHDLLPPPAARQAAGYLQADLPGSPLHGMAQLMFQSEALSGLIFWLGIVLGPLVCQGLQAGRKQALRLGGLTFTSAALAGILATLLGAPSAAVGLGLYGFNAVLAALGTALHRTNWWQPLVFALLTVPCTMAFQALSVPAFSAPFMLVTWLSHGLISLKTRRGGDAQR